MKLGGPLFTDYTGPDQWVREHLPDAGEYAAAAEHIRLVARNL